MTISLAGLYDEQFEMSSKIPFELVGQGKLGTVILVMCIEQNATTGRLCNLTLRAPWFTGHVLKVYRISMDLTDICKRNINAFVCYNLLPFPLKPEWHKKIKVFVCPPVSQFLQPVVNQCKVGNLTGWSITSQSTCMFSPELHLQYTIWALNLKHLGFWVEIVVWIQIFQTVFLLWYFYNWTCQW